MLVACICLNIPCTYCIYSVVSCLIAWVSHGCKQPVRQRPTVLVSTPQRYEHNVICGALDVMITRYCGIVQVVDGVLTDDNDAFLYGAKTVYCELSANEKVMHHTMGCVKPRSYKPLMKHNAKCSSWHTIQSVILYFRNFQCPCIQ